MAIHNILEDLHGVMEPYIEELRATGVLDAEQETVKLFFDDVEVYFGSKEINRMRIYAKQYEEILGVIEDEGDEQC